MHTHVNNSPRVFPSSGSLSLGVFDDGVGADDGERDPVLHVPDLLLVLLLEDERALVGEVINLDAGLSYLTHDLEM